MCNDNFLRTGFERLAEDRARVDYSRAVLMPDRNENRLGKNLAVRIERQTKQKETPTEAGVSFSDGGRGATVGPITASGAWQVQ